MLRLCPPVVLKLTIQSLSLATVLVSISFLAGPVDVVRDVISFTGESGVTLIGYDWGAGIAISTALLAPGVIKRIVVFNATYTEQGKELSAVRCPASILWTKGDQFHPVAWANKLKDRLKTASLTIFPSGTSHESTVVTEAIVGAVVGKNAGKPAKTAGKPTPDAKAKAGASEAVRKERSEGKGVEEKEEEGKGRGEEEEEGKDAVARSSRFLRSRSSSLGARSSRPSIRAHTISPSRGVGGSVSDSIAAVAEFRAAWEAGALPKLYGAMLGRGDTSMHSAAVKVLVIVLCVCACA